MTKLWQDKTDKEFKADIMKMVEEGKLTKWNPWDHIKTLDEAKDYVEAIYEEWGQESQAANDCIVDSRCNTGCCCCCFFDSNRNKN